MYSTSLHRTEVTLESFIPHAQNSQQSVSVKLGGLHSRCELGGERQKLLSLPEIESELSNRKQFLTHSQMAALLRLLRCRERSKLFLFSWEPSFAKENEEGSER